MGAFTLLVRCTGEVRALLLGEHHAIEKKGAALTRQDASRYLGAHLCRCTGYVNMIAAVRRAAQLAGRA
jgi:aerobic-type carbon monoxide dehydrogenase small subunit (CoxS/CutS family)